MRVSRVIAIVQARMGSTRLPGKVLADIEGQPLLWYVLQRAREAKCLDAVVVATPQTHADLAIHLRCAAWGVPCFWYPNTHDVLGRYATVADTLQADLVVRLTADCPLIDPRLIDQVVWSGLENQTLYASNVYPRRTFPDGLDVECLTTESLVSLHRHAEHPSDREHVTPLLQRHLSPHQYANVTREPSLGHLRWTVDTDGDLDFVREVYRRMAPRWDFGWEEVLNLGEFARRAA
jgi:spore coat polysaccharide biosynthesis protein SpsF